MVEGGKTFYQHKEAGGAGFARLLEIWRIKVFLSFTVLCYHGQTLYLFSDFYLLFLSVVFLKCHPAKY